MPAESAGWTTDGHRITRRDVLATALGAGVAGAVGVPSLARAAAAAPGPGGDVSVTLTQGTNICPAVGPDGTVVFDLLGLLWTVPGEGGAARRIGGDPDDDVADVTQPDVSPDGRIVFQSYRDGNFNLYLCGVDGSGLRRLTEGPYDHREPRFSPDGQRIAFSSDRDGASYGIYVLDLASGEIITWANGEAEEGAPTWRADGAAIAFTAGDTAIDEVDAGGVRRTLATVDTGRLDAPSLGPGGELAYTVTPDSSRADLVVGGQAVTSGEDVFGFRARWLPSGEILYAADGMLRRRNLSTGDTSDVPFSAEVSFRRKPYRRRRSDLDPRGRRRVRGIVGPVLSPDGASVAFGALGDLWTMRIGARPVKITDDEFFAVDPAWSPDGATLAYTSDRAGNPDLYLRDVAAGTERRLTALEHAAVRAAWSPDGARIAFQDQDGATYVVEVATGAVQPVLEPLFAPGRPSWSPDGARLALAALCPASKRFREGASQLLILDLATGAVTYTEPVPGGSISTRGYDGPAWSPDGRSMAFVLGGVLWVLPVDAAGQPTGEARQVNDEITDAPSWSGGSRRLLYLSGGRLRLIDAEGGRASGVELPLTWTAARPSGRTVIHAGALWDGRSDRLRRDVTVVVEGNRIARVHDGHERGHGGTVVDATGLTLMPGLMDMHNHTYLSGNVLGTRQGRTWLAFGITTTRSPGDPIYSAVEEREAITSGGRLGPRYVGTGEAVDGSRIYYNFMRPVRDRTELDREIARARELDYDLVKAYVRLGFAEQRVVVDAAHAAGTWVTSHYLYPSVRLGLDGMEHLGATSRLGYSQTLSRLGHSYQDVRELFSASRMALTPTLFNSTGIYGEDDSLAIDPRVAALYPAWERAALATKVETSRGPAGAAARAALAANTATITAVHRAGGLVIAGTDAPLDNVAISLHQNLRAMVRYGGLRPVEALTTATVNAAEAINATDDLGTVEPDKLADLVLVTGDPLARIEDAAAVHSVLANGVLYTVDDLLAPYTAPAPLAAPVRNTRLDPLPADRRHWWHDPHEWGTEHSCC